MVSAIASGAQAGILCTDSLTQGAVLMLLRGGCSCYQGSHKLLSAVEPHSNTKLNMCSTKA